MAREMFPESSPKQAKRLALAMINATVALRASRSFADRLNSLDQSPASWGKSD